MTAGLSSASARSLSSAWMAAWKACEDAQAAWIGAHDHQWWCTACGAGCAGAFAFRRRCRFCSSHCSHCRHVVAGIRDRLAAGRGMPFMPCIISRLGLAGDRRIGLLPVGDGRLLLFLVAGKDRVVGGGCGRRSCIQRRGRYAGRRRNGAAGDQPCDEQKWERCMPGLLECGAMN